MILLLLLLSCLIYFEELCCIFAMEGKIKRTCLVFQMDLNSSGVWGCSIALALSKELVLNCTALVRAAGRCCGCTWANGWGHTQTSWSADLSRFTLRLCHWSKSPHSFHLVPFGLHWAELWGHDLGSFQVILNWKCVLVLRALPGHAGPDQPFLVPLTSLPGVPNPILVQSEENSLFPRALPSHSRISLTWFPLPRLHPDPCGS